MLKNIKKVLLVEDDILELTMMNRAIKDLGHQNLVLSHAKDGTLALQIVKEEIPHLIILDLSMPKMNGLELLSEIKRDPDLKQIPVVVFTSSNNGIDKQNCYLHGASGYIVKPIEYKQYLSTVQILLDYWDHNEQLEIGIKTQKDIV